MAEDKSFFYNSVFLKGIFCRCPRCGEGKLFKGFLTFRDKCQSCNLSFSEFDTGDGPAFVVNSLLCVIAGAISLTLELKGGATWQTHLMIWAVIIIGCTLLLLRPTKGLFAGLQNKLNAKS